jgi:hypothetical protein
VILLDSKDLESPNAAKSSLPIEIYEVKFQVPTAVSMKMSVF